VLKDLVAPPSLLNKLKSVAQAQGASTGTSTAASLESSPVPWRKAGIKYTNNEIFFDVIEEIDCIIDSNGQIVSSEISGRIEANSRLSGFPDVLLSFVNPQVMEDVAFHPCVRFARYEQDRSLSFVPPDGVFELMRYRAQYPNNAPFYVTPKISFHKDSGRLNIMVGMKAGGRDVPEKGIQDVKCTVHMPKNTESVRLDATQGTHAYDNMTKELKWDVGRISQNKVPSLNGNVSGTAGTEFGENTGLSVLVDFKLPMIALSGLRIDTVTLTNEKYKPYKGVRPVTKAGRYQVRTG
jgi:AP-3 complex subunit mu